MFDGPVSKPLYRGVRTVAASAALVVLNRVFHKSWTESLAIGGSMLIFGTAVIVYCVYLDRHPELLERYNRRSGG
jgi:hypothetical protein